MALPRGFVVLAATRADSSPPATAGNGSTLHGRCHRRSPKPLLAGKVRVWELAAAPKAQLPPRHLYTRPLPKGSSSNFVILHNYSIVVPAAKEGAVDFRRITDGDIQSRAVIFVPANGAVAGG